MYKRFQCLFLHQIFLITQKSVYLYLRDGLWFHWQCTNKSNIKQILNYQDSILPTLKSRKNSFFDQHFFVKRGKSFCQKTENFSDWFGSLAAPDKTKHLWISVLIWLGPGMNALKLCISALWIFFPYFRIFFYADLRMHFLFNKNTEQMSVIRKYKFYRCIGTWGLCYKKLISITVIWP